jgi:hypothetical protein
MGLFNIAQVSSVRFQESKNDSKFMKIDSLYGSAAPPCA